MALGLTLVGPLPYNPHVMPCNAFSKGRSEFPSFSDGFRLVFDRLQGLCFCKGFRRTDEPEYIPETKIGALRVYKFDFGLAPHPWRAPWLPWLPWLPSDLGPKTLPELLP